LGVGISLPGLVDIQTGHVTYLPNVHGLNDLNLGDILASELGVPVLLDNTVRAMTLAEKRLGRARALTDFLYVYVGDGVSAGVFSTGTLYRGRHGASVEFGHISIAENGPLCNCGNHGCLEVFVSKHHIIDRVRSSTVGRIHTSLRRPDAREEPLTLSAIRNAALEGDKYANVVITDVADRIGIGLAHLVNTFDPEVTIVGGEVFDEFDEILFDRAVHSARLNTMNVLSSRFVVERSDLSERAAALGAALLTVESALESGVLNY
jgi:predicted NBD/HSP70 family sugar kinase